MKIKIENYTKSYCVYMIKDTVSQKVYVGSTSNLLCRLANHISSFKKGNCLCSSAKAFENSSYVFEVLRNDLTKNNVKEVERTFIIAYGDRCVNLNLPIVIPIADYRKQYYNKTKPIMMYDNAMTDS